jgi:hypothetical protein
VSFDTDAVAGGVQPVLVGFERDGRSEMQTFRSANSRRGMHVAKHLWVLLITAALANVTAIRGISVLPSSNALAVASSRQQKASLASAETYPSDPAATR